MLSKTRKNMNKMVSVAVARRSRIVLSARRRTPNYGNNKERPIKMKRRESFAPFPTYNRQRSVSSIVEGGIVTPVHHPSESLFSLSPLLLDIVLPAAYARSHMRTEFSFITTDKL